MIYQLRANLFFDSLDPINDIKDKILDHFDNAIVVNPNSDNQELSLFQVIKNHHDEDPNAPCFILEARVKSPPPP